MEVAAQQDRLRPLFEWRQLVASKDGPSSPTTRLVLLTLALYMSIKGDSCFPSIESLVEDTGLSKPSVVKHLQIAEQEGWITKSKHGYAGQAWARNEYEATIPGRSKAVKDVNHVAGGEGGKPPDEGGKADTSKAVKEVNSISSENSSENSSGGNAHAPARERPSVPVALSIYRSFFPQASPTDADLARINGLPVDADAQLCWRQACSYWQEGVLYKHWQPENVGGLIDRYHKLRRTHGQRLRKAGKSRADRQPLQLPLEPDPPDPFDAWFSALSEREQGELRSEAARIERAKSPELDPESITFRATVIGRMQILWRERHPPGKAPPVKT